jgi:hypothetical protein
MNNQNLINETISLLIEMGIINSNIDLKVIKENLESKLYEVDFIENLINVIFIKYNRSSNKRNIDYRKIQKVVLQLEKIRLQKEFIC